MIVASATTELIDAAAAAVIVGHRKRIAR